MASDLPKTFKRRVAIFLDRLGAVLFPRQRRTPRRTEAPRAVASLSQKAVIGALSALFILAFIYAVNYYSSTRVRISQSPFVTNLTQEGLQASVHVGNGPACTVANELVDCWTTLAFDASHWQKVRVPMTLDRAVDTLEGYKNAAKDALVYYRILVPVKDELLARPDEIAFTPVYVNHTRYEVFLNGRQIGVGNGTTSLGATVNIGLPRSDIVNGKALLVIRGTLETGLTGISSRGDAFVGPKALLDEVYVHAERAGGTYRLLFLLTKGGIFVVFTLFFIFSGGQRGLFSFLTFAFFSTIENVFVGDFLTNIVPNPNALDSGVFLSKVLATNAFLSYIFDFCEIPRRPRLARAISASAIVVVLIMLFDYGWGTRTIRANHLLAVTSGYLVGAVFFSLVVSALTLRMWRREGFASSAVKSLRNLSIYLTVYFVLLAWESTLNSFLGFDKRALFDLLLFYYMAFNTAKDLGHKEGQVRSLEAHMIEKRRMETELQEAAEIARAFLPHSLPIWPAVAIAAYHQPLTENSGDWFAFETAQHRNLRHFVLCDITGHGVQAAIVVSSCKTALSLIQQIDPDAVERDDFIAHYACALNSVLFQQGEGNHITTILGLTFDCDAGRLHFASGGHPLPLFIAADEATATGERKKLAHLISRNTVLGAAPNVTIKMATHALAPGDIVLAHTDGLPIGPNVKVLRDFLSKRGLFADDALKGLYDKVWESHRARTGSGPDDDVSVVAFRFDGLAGARNAG